jgi:hypothetical protein
VSSTCTFLKELVSEDSIGTHLSIDADNGPSDFLVFNIGDVDIIDVVIYFAEVGMDSLQATSSGEIFGK